MQTRQPDNQELLDAVQKRDIDLVAGLIRRGTDINVASRNGWTPLMLAILSDSLTLVKLLLANGADPNLATTSEENPYRAPLAVAIRNGRSEIVELLMEHGVSTTPYDQPTPLDLARELALRPLHRERMAKIVSLLESHRALQQ